MKIKKIKSNKEIKVVAQKPCKCAGSKLLYPPKDMSCFYDCSEYKKARYYQSQCL